MREIVSRLVCAIAALLLVGQTTVIRAGSISPDAMYANCFSDSGKIQSDFPTNDRAIVTSTVNHRAGELGYRDIRLFYS